VTYNRESFAAFRVLPWSVSGSSVSLEYALDHKLFFTETITYPVPVDVSVPGVSAALDLLAAVAGVSYFKVASPHRLVVSGALTAESQALLGLLYDDGLREYAYRNGLPVPFLTSIEMERRTGATPAPDVAIAHAAGPSAISAAVSGAAGKSNGSDASSTSIGSTMPGHSPAQDRPATTVGANPAPGRAAIQRPLLPMGGGRDSGLLATLVRHRDPLLLSVGTNPYVVGLAEHLGVRTVSVGRRISPNIGELNRGEAMNGHIPVTAINTLVSVVAALLLGCDSVLLANESSASSPTITTADGFVINHQFSKSLVAERALSAALAAEGVPLTTFSAVRPYGELAIAQAFARHPELFGLIMSCNRAFVRDAAARSAGWCGQCAKCRFVYLTLAPFTTPAQLVAMFGDDLLASSSPADVAGFVALLADDRPFDCVGEVSEARLAVGLLATSPDWSTHPIVRSLAAITPPLDAADLARSLAPNPDHDVPADVLADLASAFA
jgi:UDP-N-acetyl-alpha-D-muramoyl-L-alanyl-L-glutamate epimerase